MMIQCDICNTAVEQGCYMYHIVCQHIEILLTIVLSSNPVPTNLPLSIIYDGDYDLTSNFEYLEEDELLPYEVDVSIISSRTDKQKLQDDDICPICLDSLNEKEVVCQMNVCKHNYCKTCIERWVNTNRECPMCKRDMW